MTREFGTEKAVCGCEFEWCAGSLFVGSVSTGTGTGSDEYRRGHSDDVVDFAECVGSRWETLVLTLCERASENWYDFRKRLEGQKKNLYGVRIASSPDTCARLYTPALFKYYGNGAVRSASPIVSSQGE